MDSLNKTFMEDQNDGPDDSLLRGNYDEKPLKCEPKKHYITILTFAFTAIIGGIAASAIWANFWPENLCLSNLPEKDPSPPIAPLLHCGNSPTEARFLGCKFQTWSYSWVPEPCFDSELNAEFVTIHKKDDLPYYADRNGTQAVDYDTVYQGEVEVLYTVWVSHFWHCAFLMRKFFRNKAMLTVASLDYEHIEHCQMWLSDPFRYDFRRVNTKAELFYGTCDTKGFEAFGHGNFDTID